MCVSISFYVNICAGASRIQREYWIPWSQSFIYSNCEFLMLEHGISDNLNMCSQSMVIHIWLEIKAFLFPFKVRLKIL